MIRRIARTLLGRPRPDTPEHLPSFGSYADTEAGREIGALMQRYTTDRLKTVEPATFQSHVEGLPGTRSWKDEGFAETDRQRDFSIEFVWGHDHDFGSFEMAGAMGTRHIDILAAARTVHGFGNTSLAGKKVLDIGCWTGGTSLLMAAMGAEVYAIEEVKKYADTLTYLAEAFGLDSIEVERRSLYSLDDPAFFDRFDIVLYAGVLYHVTDPVLSLRIVFNALKDGGQCLLETMGIDRHGRYCEYQGAGWTLNRERGETPRGGWNWFVPSLATVEHMVADAGFEVEGASFHEGNRILAVARRTRHVDILRAGLAVPGIR